MGRRTPSAGLEIRDSDVASTAISPDGIETAGPLFCRWPVGREGHSYAIALN